MDKLILGIPKPDPAVKLYAHVRCSAEHLAEIERIGRLCTLNNRKVVDALLAFAIKRVKLTERKLYDLEIADLGEDEEAGDEDQQA